MRRVRPLLLGLALCPSIWLVACAGDSADVAETELWTVPSPSLGELESAVGERLGSARRELDAVLDRALEGDASDAELAGAMGRLGKLYQAHGFPDAAEACYLNAQALAPEDPAWPYLLGRVYDGLGRLQEAETAYERALELRPSHLPSRVRLGRLLREQNRLREAADAFDEALRRDPRSPAALAGAGRVALAQEDFAAAAERLEAALDEAPAATEIFYPLGLAYRGLGRLDEARAALAKRGTVAAPLDDPLMEEVRDLETGMRLHLNRGTAAFGQGLYRQAVESFRKAVEADPQSPLARVNLAAALGRVGDDAGALEHARKALEIDPSHPRANFSMATLLARRGQDPEALEHYARALEADPGFKDAHFNYANALRRLGRLDEAEKHFEAVIRLDPHHAGARLGRILSLARGGSWRQAVERAEQGYELLDGHPALAEALARLLAACPVDELRDGERALGIAEELFRRQKALGPLEAVAMASAETGRFEDAVRYQEAALQAVEGAGNPRLVSRARGALELYRSGRPSRDPWPP